MYVLKYSVVFFKAFSKKKLFGGPCISIETIGGDVDIFDIEKLLVVASLLRDRQQQRIYFLICLYPSIPEIDATNVS